MMENYRNDVIVIFAGYPDKMERFLEKNEGLRSRIAFHVDFPDYNVEELCDILKLMSREKDIFSTKRLRKSVALSLSARVKTQNSATADLFATCWSRRSSSSRRALSANTKMRL